MSDRMTTTTSAGDTGAGAVTDTADGTSPAPDSDTPSTSPFASVPEALRAMREGRPVLVLDDADRENEGDVILAGETLTSEWMAWTIRHSSGYVCAPMTDERADVLGLPLMVTDTQDRLRTAYTITVDAARGVTTGISAADRTRTVRLLSDPAAGEGDFTRPGHVVPLRARPGGVLERRGHTEACVDLARLAGLAPVGAIAELVHDSGEMMRTADVLALGAEMGLPVITIEELVAYRALHDRVARVATSVLPTEHGTFTVHGYRDLLTGAEHLALISPHGAAATGGQHPTVRVHSECLTGDTFGSLRCDCGPQLQRSLAEVGVHGGVVVYLRGHEGRGVGLLAKLRAYALQDAGADTVDAQTHLGLPVDAREYGSAAAILADMGIGGIRLLTGNPDKVDELRAHGIDVHEVTPVGTRVTPENERYLRTKAERMGHAVLGLGDPDDNPSPSGRI